MYRGFVHFADISPMDSIPSNWFFLLQNAFVANNINVEVAALVNDTVGTLVAHVIEAPDTVLGM